MSTKQSIQKRLPSLIAALIAALLLVDRIVRLAILFFKGAFGEIHFLAGGEYDISYNFDPELLGEHWMEMGVLLALIVGIVFLIIYLVRPKRSFLIVSLAAGVVSCVVMAILPAAVKESILIYEYNAVRYIPEVGADIAHWIFPARASAVRTEIGYLVLKSFKFIPIILSEGLMLISFFTHCKKK